MKQWNILQGQQKTDTQKTSLAVSFFLTLCPGTPMNFFFALAPNTAPKAGLILRGMDTIAKKAALLEISLVHF